jgi:hypothetical protein
MTVREIRQALARASRGGREEHSIPPPEAALV